MSSSDDPDRAPVWATWVRAGVALLLLFVAGWFALVIGAASLEFVGTSDDPSKDVARGSFIVLVIGLLASVVGACFMRRWNALSAGVGISAVVAALPWLAYLLG